MSGGTCERARALVVVLVVNEARLNMFLSSYVPGNQALMLDANQSCGEARDAAYTIYQLNLRSPGAGGRIRYLRSAVVNHGGCIMMPGTVVFLFDLIGLDLKK